MRRSSFTKPRKPMARGTSTLKRTKRLGPGKKKLAKAAAMKAALLSYFDRFGWEDEPDTRKAPCQLSGVTLTLTKVRDEEGNLLGFHTDANAHHKRPRSEMRKAGVKDLDAPHRLLVVHYGLHLAFIHERGVMGRPKDPEKRRRFALVEQAEANAANGQRVKLEGQDAHDLERLIQKGASRG
jgi:hypothetical protein